MREHENLSHDRGHDAVHERERGEEHSDHAGHEEHTSHAGHEEHSDHAGHEQHSSHADSSHAGHEEHSSHAGHEERSSHAGHEQHSSPAGHEEHSAHAGHGGHAGHGDHVGMFRRLFWWMLALAVPTVLLSGMFASIVGYDLPDQPWARWVSPVLGTVLYAVGGRPFLTGAVDELRARRPGMMLLIALAITVAFVASWAATLGIAEHDLDFWWELALLVVIMLLGHWLEMRSLAQTSSALDSLAALLPDEAEREVDGGTERVSPDALRVGDVVVVRPGARVPADGEIIAGSASFDESMITGESRPVARGIADRVVAGTVATDSGVRVRVDATGDETAIAGIRRLVADAQASTSKAQRLADRAAGWLFWFALIAAALTAVAWTIAGAPDDAVVRAVTVLVIACPHALGLAIPLVVSIATERAARGGVLIADRLALETMRAVDVVLFDKTGTLTAGEPALVELHAVDGDTDRLLALAAAAESASEHPLARAIVRAAEERALVVPDASDFSSSPAVGVTATVDERRVRVGGPHLLGEEAAHELPQVEPWRAEGAIILHVVVDGRVEGALRLADEIRPESKQAVDALHRLGVEVAMVTGDAEAVARSVAGRLGIDRVAAGVRPEHKEREVARLQAEGHRVAFVGDGVNDAPALARADVGLAIGAGTDVAIASADVILASSDPRSVLSVFELSHASARKMVQNLWWAAGYNLLSVPLAAGVLAPVGFVLPMSVGALLMSVSTIVVALNAQLLRRLDLTPEASTARVLRG
ncbi:heavy metal translocating P-type ATPase [Agrococcus beijingensis]|uniref:heavy metal translocating P-type ATPase n=1 Tax=Agrococcus beijingensis TaxID=3068634 RepID=UPI0027411737|nr:heavy metal translocating P-type ATPase [Agrococcus sp. REN33]